MRNLRGIPAAVVAALLLALTPGVAHADPYQATLTVTPNPTVFTDSNAYFTFTGCGYDPSTGVQIDVTTPTALSFFGGPVDADGCISITHNGFVTEPGTYYASSYQIYQRGQGVHAVHRADADPLVVTAS